MKKIFRYLLTVIVTVTPGFTVFAEEAEDEIEFEPIHATITPGSGVLKIEEAYYKKSMITTDGDALIFKSGKEPIRTNSIELPINAMEDYTMDFTFRIPKFSGRITMSFNGYGIMFGKKMADAYKTNGVLLNNAFLRSKNKKFKMPDGKEKNQIVCKIVKRKKIVTVFLNDQYVSEFTVKPMSPKLEFNIDFFGAEGELQSIRLDQGADEESDD